MATEIFSRGLVAYYEANSLTGSGGDVVSTLEDLSGNGRDWTVSANKPTILAAAANGKKAVRFDGTNDPLAFDGDVTIRCGFLVFRQNGNFTGTYQGVLSSLVDTGILAGIGGSGIFYDFGHDYYEYRLNDRIYSPQWDSYGNKQSLVAPAPVDEFGIIYFKFWKPRTIDGIQLGQDRDFTDRKGDFDFLSLALYERDFCESEIRKNTAAFSYSFQLPIKDVFPFQGMKSDGGNVLRRILTDEQPEPVTRIKDVARETFDLSFTGREESEFDAAKGYWRGHYPHKRFIYRDYQHVPPIDFNVRFATEFQKQGTASVNNFGYGFGVVESALPPDNLIMTAPVFGTDSTGEDVPTPLPPIPRILVISDGDSITFRLAAPDMTAYPTVMASNLGGNVFHQHSDGFGNLYDDGNWLLGYDPEARWTFVNTGLPGKKLSELDGFAPNRIDKKYDPEAKNILIIHAGSNDLDQGDTASDVQTRVQTYVAARKAAAAAKGITLIVYVCTIMPRSYGIFSSFEIHRGTYNTWLRANWATFADGLIDFAADPRLDDFDDTTYFEVDQTHPNAAGAAALADVVQTKLLADLGDIGTASPYVNRVNVGGEGYDGGRQYFPYFNDDGISTGSTFAINNTYDLSLLTHPPLQQVFWGYRYNGTSFTTTVPSVPAGDYLVRVYCSDHVTGVTLSVAVNGVIPSGWSAIQPAAEAGATYKPVQKEATVTHAGGNMTITHTKVAGSNVWGFAFEIIKQ